MDDLGDSGHNKPHASDSEGSSSFSGGDSESESWMWCEPAPRADGGPCAVLGCSIVKTAFRKKTRVLDDSEGPGQGTIKVCYYIGAVGASRLPVQGGRVPFG
jgi:hypothetical protein